jgi:hypothetical protein
MLTDGFGMYTAAVGGLRTTRKEVVSPNTSSKGGTTSQHYKKTQKKKGNSKMETTTTTVTKIAPIDPRSLPPQLSGPVGKSPPFVWNPSHYDSIEDSVIRTTSILDDQALDSVHFARPRPAQAKPKPRPSSSSSRVLGNSYGGPGYSSPRQLSPSEHDEVSANRGTAFSPFCIQKGKPRPPNVVHDAPWDNSGKNVVQVIL